MSDVIHEAEFDDELPTLKLVRPCSAVETPRREKPVRHELRANGKVYRYSFSLSRLLECDLTIPDGATIHAGRKLIATFRHTHRTPSGRVIGHWELTADGAASSRVA